MAVDYVQIIKQLLTEYVNAYNKQYPNAYQLLFDPERQQYQVLHIGWEGSRRVYSVPLHFRLENGKIWIEQNNTDREIASELMELGVPAEHIVLAFHPPSLRHLTGFATQ
jgi:hypothetical protein